MSNQQAPQPEPTMRWLLTPEPLMGTVCMHMGEAGWARLQTRQLVGFARTKDGLIFTYTEWQDTPVETPPQLALAMIRSA